MNRVVPFLIVATLVQAMPALAGPSSEQICEASKNQIVGKYLACLSKAYSTAAKKASPPDFAKCDATFSGKWDVAEAKGGVACPDAIASAGEIGGYLSSQATDIADIVAGNAGVPVCGDGVVNAVGELCDGPDLEATTCTSLSYASGTLLCDSGCQWDLSNCNH